MKKGAKPGGALGIVGLLASVATLASFLFGVATFFWPDLVPTLSRGVTGNPVTTASGGISPEFIASQVNVLYWALSILVVLGGLTFMFFHYAWEAGRAEAATSSEDSGPWMLLVMGVAALTLVLLSISVPAQIFELSSSSPELQRQAGFFAWPARSMLGGLLLGIAVVACAAVVGVVAHLALLRLPRSLRKRKLQRQLLPS